MRSSRLIALIRAVWRGYKELKDAGGWAVLVFAGHGLYRYCKYRVGFTPEAFRYLQRYQARFQVAADTLHPRWRDLLTIVGQTGPPKYPGHPHDWVIVDDDVAISLKQSYLEWDSDFRYEHLEDSVLDDEKWPTGSDPRRVVNEHALTSTQFLCDVCNEKQSDQFGENHCLCFPNLFGNQKRPSPVQIIQTKNGKNNGLFACLVCPLLGHSLYFSCLLKIQPFERGVAIGQFLGRITRDLNDVDVMESDTALGGHYQIWQGREGNYTRFVNHSCRPNSQFQRFVWRGIQRVLLVSKGILAGNEITVDYSPQYWNRLDKICRCEETCCRYRERRQLA